MLRLSPPWHWRVTAISLSLSLSASERGVSGSDVMRIIVKNKVADHACQSIVRHISRRIAVIAASRHRVASLRNSWADFKISTMCNCSTLTIEIFPRPASSRIAGVWIAIPFRHVIVIIVACPRAWSRNLGKIITTECHCGNDNEHPCNEIRSM